MTIEEVEKFFKEFSGSPLSRFCYKKDGEELLLEKGNPAPMFIAPAAAPFGPKEAPGKPGFGPSSGFEKEDPGKAEKATTASSEDTASADDGSTVTVKSPMVGVFYAAESPDSAPFVTEGAAVKAGDVLCLIETMKMMSEVTAPAAGTIVKIHAANEDHVEYDMPLFDIRKDEG